MAMISELSVEPRHHFTFIPEDIHIPAEPLLRVQGYRDMDGVRAPIRQAAEETAARAEKVLMPAAYVCRTDVRSCADDVMTLVDGRAFHSTEFSKVLTGCETVFATIVTVGTGLDDELQLCLKDDDILSALFLETAGWIAIEKATKALRGHLTVLAQGEDHRLSRRLAPGYSDWELTEQAVLFALFDGVDLPIRLLDSSAMLPKMSRSGLYGLLPKT
jgi:hypothetical protein